MDNATRYEVISKETGEVFPVIRWANAQEDAAAEAADPSNLSTLQRITVVTEIGNIVFDDPTRTGNLSNERYAIREVGTHSQPDGTGTVADDGSLIDDTSL